MAITFDSSSYPTDYGNQVQNPSWTHVVGSGDNKIAIVIVATMSGGAGTRPSSVTFGGAAMTELGYKVGTYNLEAVSVWYLLDPTEGSNTVVVSHSSWGSSCYGEMGCFTFFGVDQSDSFRDGYEGVYVGSHYNATVTKNITSSASDFIVDAFLHGFSDSAFACEASQTERLRSPSYASYTLLISTKGGTTTNESTSWTRTTTDNNGYVWYSFSMQETAMVINGDMAIPVLGITASSDGVVESLPLFSLVNCYVEVPHNDFDESLPILTISATAIQSTVIAGDCTLPILTMTSLTGYQTDSELEETLPSLTASASSLTGEIHEGDCDVPFFTISASLLNGGISQGVASLPFLTFSGRTINTGTVSESLPVFTINAYAHGPLLHTLDESLPLLQVVANLVHASTSFRCYVLNTENSAITEYDNFPFNSFCTFKGKHLAAGSNGIMLLEGNKDLSTDINAYFNVGSNDFDLQNIKRITDAYLSMKGDGSYYLTVTSDDGVAHSYLLSATAGDRIKNLKTNVGKGKKGRFFELELSNLAGADFELYDMVLNVELLKRNI